MIFICILIFLILILILAMFLSIHFGIIYSDKLEIIVRFLNFEFRLNNKNKNSKKEKKKESPKKDESKINERLDLNFFLKLIKSLKDILLEFIGFLKFEKLNFRLKIGSDDKMQTALSYGQACIILYPIFSFINSLKPINNYDIKVLPDFESQKISLNMNIQIKIKVFHLLKCLIKGFIKIKDIGDFI